jgi:pimeloyl-ACP methyl ester carboxylesterase
LEYAASWCEIAGLAERCRVFGRVFGVGEVFGNGISSSSYPQNLYSKKPPLTTTASNTTKQGVSGGSPSALACAFALPATKLHCVSLVCGIGPPDIGMRGADINHRIGWPYGIRFAPYWMGRWYWRFIGLGRIDLSEADRIEILAKQLCSVPESERDIYDDPDFLRLLVRATGEAFVQGYDGVWDDGKISCRDWGFKVQDIRKDLTVHLWYGRKDVFVPLNHGVTIKERLGERARLRVEDEAHGGILMHWKREIFAGLRDCMGG